VWKMIIGISEHLGTHLRKIWGQRLEKRGGFYRGKKDPDFEGGGDVGKNPYTKKESYLRGLKRWRGKSGGGAVGVPKT